MKRGKERYQIPDVKCQKKDILISDICRLSSESGSVLVSAMILLLVMSLMGIGLVQASVQSTRTADVKTEDSGTFQAAETCNERQVAALKARTSPAEDDDAAGMAIPEQNLSSLYTGDETAAQLAKLSGYSYRCTITKIASKAVTGDSAGQGDDIGTADGYGAYGDTSPRYYYQVDTIGNYKVQNVVKATKHIISVISMEF